MRQISLNLQGLTQPQLRLFQSLKRFIIVCWGRQSGKTTAGLYLILHRALSGRKGGVYWFVLQTHNAAEIAFNRMWDFLRDTKLMPEKPNESERFIRLINGSTIFFKSGENFEDLRAETLDGVVVDEYRQQKKGLWSRVLRPMLARFNAWAVILSTSNGFDDFYDLFESAKLKQDWEAFHAPSTEAPWWTSEEIESARSEMSEDEFAQEIMAEFREFGVGKVYKNHGPWNQALANPFAIRGQAWSPYLPIVVGLDFNVGLMCWVLGQVRDRASYWGEEIAVPNTNTQECAPILLEKVQGHKPGVILIGDASGKARRSSATENDYKIVMRTLIEGGVQAKNLTPEANPPIRTRVNIVNASLRDANKVTHTRYNPLTCPTLKKDLERVIWKPGSGELDFDKSDPLRTHMSDAFGYPHCHYGDTWKPKPGRMRVLSR